MWLDELSRAGRVVWTRIAPLEAKGRFRVTPRSWGEDDAERRPPGSMNANGARSPSPVRTTPIVLASRRHLGIWASLAPDADGAPLGSRARMVLEFIAAHGASFFDELVDGCRLLGAEVEDALGELVAHGLVNADRFAGLRELLVPSDRRRGDGGRRRPRRSALFGIEDAGRWALARRRRAGADDVDVVEHVARSLLRRYGVVCWRLVAREADWLPPWRDLLRCLRRLEARGDVRGGRFVAGISGEQYAMPEAIGLLRDVRRREPDGALLGLSGADPLNLVGVLSPGARLPALTGNRVLYRDGVPIALLAGGEVRFLEALPPDQEWTARNALLRRHVPAVLQRLG
jgi:ATP-dependent Lhr-like helicase